MATPHGETHADSAPFRRPTNPLGRPFWMLSLAENDRQREAATIAGLCSGIHALARILANNQAFYDAQLHSSAVEPGHWPFDAELTEGLFAALYFLSEQAASLAAPKPDDPAFG
jgi:hypothetical protein